VATRILVDLVRNGSRKIAWNSRDTRARLRMAGETTMIKIHRSYSRLC
jgi:hypothetical protein